MNKLKVKHGTERKLTQLLSTNTEFMCFTSYYLWFLIDNCHFIVDDVQEALVFTKNTAFNSFVEEFKSKRVEYIKQGNKGGEKYCKMVMNAAYGFDGLNEEKYSKVDIRNKENTFRAQMRSNFMGTRQINDDTYIVSVKSPTYGCRTCMQEALFTLDNAKFWYLNVYYNFFQRAFDFNRIHYIEGDTDSGYLAVAGDPTKGIQQGLSEVIKDKEFYDANVYKFFPDPGKGWEHAKKLLGLSIEKEGDVMIATAPKTTGSMPMTERKVPTRTN
jgi:hypothetical protein